MQLEHVNITVKQYKKCVSFYKQIFDFDTRWEGEIQGVNGPLNACHLGTKNFYIAIFEAEQEGEVKHNYRKPGFNHLAFQVDNLEYYKTLLKKYDVDIDQEQSYDPGRRLYFYDPEGIEIELVQYTS